MALPVANAPIYDIKVPSTGEKVKFRPFLVKEEKALLLAQQSEDLSVMVNTIKDVIRACTSNKLDVDKLAIFDIEYLFSQIRAKSVGETIELIFRCDTCEDEKAKVKLPIQLDQIKVEIPPEHNKKIDLFNDVGVVMKYPTIDVLKDFETIQTEDVDAIFKIVCKSIDYIYSGEEIFHGHEQSLKDLEEFINNLTQDQFKKLQVFFETMPKLRHKVEYDCPVCSKHHVKYVEGLDSFFS